MSDAPFKQFVPFTPPSNTAPATAPAKSFSLPPPPAGAAATPPSPAPSAAVPGGPVPAFSMAGQNTPWKFLTPSEEAAKIDEQSKKYFASKGMPLPVPASNPVPTVVQQPPSVQPAVPTPALTFFQTPAAANGAPVFVPTPPPPPPQLQPALQVVNSIVNAPGKPRVVSADQFLAIAPAGPPEWLWDGVIPRYGIVFLAGEPYSHKSVLALILAAAARTGGTVAGRTVRPARVLYIILEHVGSSLHDVLRRTKTAFAVPDLSNIFILDELRIDEDDSLDYAIKSAEAFAADVVVIDSFRRSHSGEENNSQDAAEHIRRLQNLSGGGSRLVIAIHHLAKGSPTLRGSTDYKAGSDATITVKKSGDSRILSAENHSGADVTLKLQFTFEDDSIQVVASSDPTSTSSAGTSKAQVAQAILAACKAKPGLTLSGLRREVQNRISAGNDLIGLVVKELIHAGTLKDLGKKGKHAFHAV